MSLAWWSLGFASSKSKHIKLGDSTQYCNFGGVVTNQLPALIWPPVSNHNCLPQVVGFLHSTMARRDRSLQFLSVSVKAWMAACVLLGPLLLTWFIPAWISNYTHYNVWDEITYPFLNFNGATVEVSEWIGNFIPHFIGHVITYPCWD